MKKISIIIIAFTLVLFGRFVLINRQYFLRKFDPIYFGQLYSNSQYVKGPLSMGGIGDDGLYAFAEYYYLFQGGDVSSVNFEHPPLGKYLIGLSIFLFQNENLINLFYFAVLLLVTYKLCLKILKNQLVSLIAVFILSIDPLFLDNLIRSQLDLPLTLFFTLGVYYYLKGSGNRKNYYFSNLFMGMAFSTRFFPFLPVIILYFLILLFIYQKDQMKYFFLSCFLIPIIYLVAHTAFFIYHPSLIEFLQHKKWMLSWFRGSKVIIGNIWKDIFTGYYFDSTGKVRRNDLWTPVIPIVAVFSLGSIIRQQIIKIERNRVILYGLVLIFLIYVTILTDGIQKFLMPVYPVMIILTLTTAVSLYSIIVKWIKRMRLRLKAG
jgi:predicted membrane-bound dolichyl-phosphate-mannose-protein mannosyltransferase